MQEPGRLCEKCQSFGLSPTAFRSSPYEERRMHQLGRFVEVKARTDCALCRFLTEAFVDGPGTDRISQDEALVQGTWSSISDDLPNACLLFWLVANNYVDKIEFSIRHIRDDEGPMLGDARVINDAFVNVNLVKKWVNICEKEHDCKDVPIEATRASRLPDGFMVIDVVDNCLIGKTYPCRYLALSYVWGNSIAFMTTSQNVDMLRAKDSIGHIWNQLSPTIQDAILFTRQLGERYIWIDSLCILQDNAQNAAANIEAMDSIYRYAMVGLLVAEDNAASRGLPGVSNPRQVHQFRSELLPGLRVLGRFNHSAYLDQAKYRSRGWTYQEEQLSTRALIFANHQLSFVCPSHVYGEDVHEGNQLGPDTVLKTPDITSRYIREGQPQSVMYFRAVQAYTLRTLTFPSDTLKAFSGIGAVLSQTLSSEMISGLPASIFDLALLWQPASKMSRKEGFPSWSWAGWHGAVRWNGDTMELASYGTLPDLKQEQQVITNWIRTRTWIDWKYRDQNGTESLVWEHNREGKAGCVFWPSSGYVEVSEIGYDSKTAIKTNPFGRHSDSDPIISTYKSRYLPTPAMRPNLTKIPDYLQPLCFQTLSAQFYIKPSNHYLRYGSVDPFWEPNGRVVFLLYTEDLQICGYVLLDEVWKSQFCAEEPYEFLLLSEANYYCDWRRPHEDHPYKRFNGYQNYEEFHVMMIEWKEVGGDGAKAAERVGLGRVLKEAVRSIDAKNVAWKEVILI
ncbi:uncharacterized protein TrAtP1_007239 [Trichoderma atroviride]|uniref:uncharacterized protein n=1 Tax=Hypocrea atroviridis TaxID=63577 RepID=UPI003316D380|nr:hypothetical protein TrAtP1_007239 [Trichoderma atroviride]